MLRSSNKSFLSVLVFISLTFLSAFILSSPLASADDTVVDEIEITVPISCNLTGVGMNTHTTSLMNGNYATDVGTTTIKAFCNDNEGFAIYAIGYTDDTDGKNVMSSSTLSSDHDIPTGLLTSGNNSQWAMKLATQTNPEPTYPISIQNNYNAYHTVPDDYDLVAKRTASTDSGTNAIGSTLTSTYQIYASPTQPAGTYIGKVKYVMVHPHTAPQPVGENQIGVIYDGNGLFFDQAGTQGTNRVVYEEQCEDLYGYISDTPTIIRTANINADGTKARAYQSNEQFADESSVDFYDQGVSKLKVIVQYGLTEETAYVDMSGSNGGIGQDNEIIDNSINRSGTETFVVNGSYASFYIETWGTPVEGYDYGLYIQVYPVYDEPTEGATYGLIEENVCSFRAVSGAYAETIPWNGYWYMEEEGGYTRRFYYETNDGDSDGIIRYLNENGEELKGGTITVYAYYPYKVIYNGNGATRGTMDGFYSEIESTEGSDELLAPNYLKTGYGFAGWSEDPSATANGNSKIFGPTEIVSYSDLFFNNNRTATLYAVWEQSAGNLQNWGGCSTMNIGEVIALTDTRDNNTYAIAKLDDSKCWMMENLRLDLSDGNTTISDSNTHSPTISFLEERQSFIGATTTRGCVGDSRPSCIDQISFDKSYINSALTPNPQSLYPSSWLAYGVLYNWYTSTAGNGTYSLRDGSAVGDICPSRWRMPSGTVEGDVYNLMASIGTITSPRTGSYTVETNRATKFPYNELSGDKTYYIHTSPQNRKGSGYIQTASGSGYSSVYNAGLSMTHRVMRFSYGGSGYIVNKSETHPVRCLTD